MKKRIIRIIICLLITFSICTCTVYEDVKAAEWAAGAVASVAGGPIFTALLIAGVVVAGGIAIYELDQTDPEDHAAFLSGIKESYKGWMEESIYQANLLDEAYANENEALVAAQEESTRRAQEWWDNCINTGSTTGDGLTVETYKYWENYCDEMNEVIDNNIGAGGSTEDDELLPDSVITTNVYNYTLYQNINPTGKDNIGANCIEFNDNIYVLNGSYANAYNSGTQVVSTANFNQTSVPSDRYRFYFSILLADTAYLYQKVCFIDVNRLTGQVITSRYGYASTQLYYPSSMDKVTQINTTTAAQDIPTFVTNEADAQNLFNDIVDNYDENLGVNNGSAADLAAYLALMVAILGNTHIGKAISTGRRALTSGGDEITGVFTEDSIPTKKSKTTVDAGTMSGQVGWDIPDAGVWDDVINGTRPYGDVVGKTGTISVPDDVITGTRDHDRVIDYPDDAGVQDSNDYPKTDEGENEKPEEVPEKPGKDVIDDQGGEYYPAEMDLTELFPFCIPFDIIYLVEKFDFGGDDAPVITIPIVYPEALQGVMGESYEITIDFEDFIVVRNIIRVFLLILFILGLMNVTRGLIRG